MGFFYFYIPCRKAPPGLTEKDIQRGTKKRKTDGRRKQYIEEKSYTVVEMLECEKWKLYKTAVLVRQLLKKSFSCSVQCARTYNALYILKRIFLVFYSVISKLQNIYEHNFPNSRHFSKTQTCTHKRLDHICKSIAC